MAIKSVKFVVQKMNNKTLTNRQASRYAQNERRKIQRRMSRLLSEQYGMNVSWKESMNEAANLSNKSSQIATLEKAYKQLQSSGTGYSTQIEGISQSVSGFSQIVFGSEKLNDKSSGTLERKNKLFERQINQSTSKNGLSALSGEESKAFYAATMDMWNGVRKSSNFNTEIMKKFGINNLETVYRLLLNEELKAEDFGFADEELFEQWIDEIDSRVNLKERRKVLEEELKNIRRSKQDGENTDEEIYNGSDQKEQGVSPDYINKIVNRIAIALNG